MLDCFLPLFLGLLTKLLARTSGPGVTLGLWQVTRSPARYTQLALLVVMAAAVGTFAATYGETTDRSQEERALYAVGSDVRLLGLGNLGTEFSDEVVTQLESVEGIEDATTAFRGGYTLGPLPSFGARVEVIERQLVVGAAEIERGARAQERHVGAPRRRQAAEQGEQTGDGERSHRSPRYFTQRPFWKRQRPSTLQAMAACAHSAPDAGTHRSFW